MPGVVIAQAVDPYTFAPLCVCVCVYVYCVYVYVRMRVGVFISVYPFVYDPKHFYVASPDGLQPLFTTIYGMQELKTKTLVAFVLIRPLKPVLSIFRAELFYVQLHARQNMAFRFTVSIAESM